MQVRALSGLFEKIMDDGQYNELAFENTRLKEALEGLIAVDNGPALCKYRDDWIKAMNYAQEVLGHPHRVEPVGAYEYKWINLEKGN